MGYWNNLEKKEHSRKVYEKICTICGKVFTHTYQRTNTCSFNCRIEKRRKRSRELMRKIRYPKIDRKIKTKKIESCIICGYLETTDKHHEGMKEYILCPNHHALITRGIKKIEELIFSVD